VRTSCAEDRAVSDANAVERYDRVAIVLHWLIAVGVLAQIAFGWWMIDIPKNPVGVRAYYFNVHKSIGITLGLLIVLRIVWRLTHAAPPLPAHVPGWQKISAKLSHFLLYACMIVMPLSGFLGSSFTKYPIKYWGYTLPYMGWESAPLKDLCSQVHYTTVIIFMSLITLHLLAAIKHMMARDGVIQRMTRG
jgi:cytochrome b561